MTEQEICVRVTRAAAKRKAMGIDEDRVSKKRVVLGELLNVSNVNVLANLNQKKETQKPKKSLRPPPAKQIKSAPVVIDLDSESDIDSRSDDPQMCGPYVRDIYEYLRELEVIILCLGF